MKEELRRKSIHLAGLIVPVVYLFMDKPTILFFVCILTGVAIAVELAKWLSPHFRAFFFTALMPLLRTHERQGAITGATYYLISTLLCIFFFYKQPAIVCIFFMVLGDTSAALVGKMWGRMKLTGQKSLEGSAACFIVCTATAIFFFSFLFDSGVQLQPEFSSLVVALVGASVATIVELLPLRVDDNLTVPLISGAAMQLIILITEKEPVAGTLFDRGRLDHLVDRIDGNVLISLMDAIGYDLILGTAIR